MELLGFYYEKSDIKIHANGHPISQELRNQGYVQKNNSNGYPRWYVKPNKVWILVEIDGKQRKFNIAHNILAIYPERQRMTLKLAQDTFCLMVAGDIEFTLKDGAPYLIRKEHVKSRKKS